MKRQRGGSQTRFKRRFGLGAVRLSVPSLHATLVLFWDSHPDVVRLIPGLKRIKICLLFVSSSGKKKTAEKLSSLIRRGAAVLIRARYPPGAGPDNLAQQLLPPRVTVPVLDMQNPANSDSVTTRWKVCCCCCSSKSCSTINPPKCASVCLFACARTHARETRKSGRHTGDGRCA